jgi:hypothetical protein
MAYVRLEYCDACKTMTNHINNDGCTICLSKKKAEKDRMWEAQDISTKITDLRKRIEELERGPRVF